MDTMRDKNVLVQFNKKPKRFQPLGSKNKKENFNYWWNRIYWLSLSKKLLN